LPKKGHGKRRSEYQQYLRSTKWRSIRVRVLSRDGNRCVACGKRARVVHHKSYAQEVLDGLNDAELVSLCKACHTTIEFEMVNGRKKKNGLAEANTKLASLTKRSEGPKQE
jgi:5-methylcytosine-specific restriction endonuclease McrA